MKTLEDLFLDSLADIYYAENQLTKALPKMAKAATHDDLREAFEAHLLETEGHVQKVERAFELFGEKPKSKKCPAIVGIILSVVLGILYTVIIVVIVAATAASICNDPTYAASCTTTN